MATAQSNPRTLALNSWKEIAGYLGRGVRTVQRYERDLGLPVRRPRGRSRSAVIALCDELDDWLRNAPTVEFEVHRNGTKTGSRQAKIESDELRTRCHNLRVAHHAAVVSLISSIQLMLQETERMKEIKIRWGGV